MQMLTSMHTFPLPGALQVFRRLYDAVGLGWVYAITRLPLIGRLADACALSGALQLPAEPVCGALVLMQHLHAAVGGTPTALPRD